MRRQGYDDIYSLKEIEVLIFAQVSKKAEEEAKIGG
jgi:hypothetical protein